MAGRESKISPGEKSILLRGLRERINDKFKQEEIAEVWFLLKPTHTGVILEEIFKDLPLGTPKSENEFKNRRSGFAEKRSGKYYFLRDSNCIQIGSFLYVLGGRDHTLGVANPVSDTVRCLNLENPICWKACEPLAYPCGSARVCAEGNRIYLFPKTRRGGPVDLPGGLIYDTSNQIDFCLVPPPGYEDSKQLWNPSFCFSYDFGDGRHGPSIITRQQQVTYCPDKKSWSAPKYHSPSFLCSHSKATHYAFLNGILYVVDWYWDDDETPVNGAVLRAYDVLSGSPLLGNGITIPKFKNYIGPDFILFHMFLVAVADYKLCYVWTPFGSVFTVCIATVVASSDDMTVRVLEEEEVVLNATDIKNCIPWTEVEQSESKEERKVPAET